MFTPLEETSFDDSVFEHVTMTEQKKQKVNDLSIMIVNTQSIRAKKESLWLSITEMNPDIVAISETWLNSSIHNSEVVPDNYEVFRRDRKDGYGGVLTAVKKTLVCN